nr:hypothetical protein [Halomonas sp.]
MNLIGAAGSVMHDCFMVLSAAAAVTNRSVQSEPFPSLSLTQVNNLMGGGDAELKIQDALPKNISRAG